MSSEVDDSVGRWRRPAERLAQFTKKGNGETVRELQRMVARATGVRGKGHGSQRSTAADIVLPRTVSCAFELCPARCEDTNLAIFVSCCGATGWAETSRAVGAVYEKGNGEIVREPHVRRAWGDASSCEGVSAWDR